MSAVIAKKVKKRKLKQEWELVIDCFKYGTIVGVGAFTLLLLFMFMII
ncbi:MAG: hypothetical protein ACRDCC_08490 [Culicoidibacterales bacterium]